MRQLGYDQVLIQIQPDPFSMYLSNHSTSQAESPLTKVSLRDSIYEMIYLFWRSGGEQHIRERTQHYTPNEILDIIFHILVFLCIAQYTCLSLF